MMVAGPGSLDGWQSCGRKVGLHKNTKHVLISTNLCFSLKKEVFGVDV